MASLFERFNIWSDDFLESKSGKGFTLAICVIGAVCAFAMGAGVMALLCMTGSIIPAIEYFTHKPKDQPQSLETDTAKEQRPVKDNLLSDVQIDPPEKTPKIKTQKTQQL